MYNSAATLWRDRSRREGIVPTFNSEDTPLTLRNFYVFREDKIAQFKERDNYNFNTII